VDGRGQPGAAPLWTAIRLGAFVLEAPDWQKGAAGTQQPCYPPPAPPAAGLNSNPAAPHPPRRGRGFVYVHIQPQHQCILTEQGGWAVDFIGRCASLLPLAGAPASQPSQSTALRLNWLEQPAHNACMLSPATQSFRHRC